MFGTGRFTVLAICFSFGVYHLYHLLKINRPLLITNLVGIILPLCSPIIHLKNILSIPSIEVDYILPLFAPSFSPALPFHEDRVPPPPDYTKDDSWSALWPRKDTADLISFGWYQENEKNPIDDPIATQDKARCDVFYLHPTTYFSRDGWNSPFDDVSAGLMVDEGIMFQQASAFHLGCRIYAPRYRQMTGAGYLNRTNGEHALNIAYSDVKRAFESFLYRRQTECRRSIILASHSQGTTLMEKLLLEYFAKNTKNGQDLRSKLVAAYLIGMEIHDGPYSYSTKSSKDNAIDRMNAKKSNNVLMPLCENATQIGCVIAYRSFLKSIDYCRDILKRPLIHEYSSRKNQRLVCTNPLNWKAMEQKMEKSEADELEEHLGCMPIVHPWANAYYVFKGETQNQSSYERLKGWISDIDKQCKIRNTYCNENGMLMVDMPVMQRVWASGYVVPFPHWTVFSFPGMNAHAYDYNLFFNNIRKNSMTRIQQWEKLHPIAMNVDENDSDKNSRSIEVEKDIVGVEEKEEVIENDWIEEDDWIVEV